MWTTLTFRPSGLQVNKNMYKNVQKRFSQQLPYLVLDSEILVVITNARSTHVDTHIP